MTNKEVQRRKKKWTINISSKKKPQNSIEYFVSYDMYTFWILFELKIKG